MSPASRESSAAARLSGFAAIASLAVMVFMVLVAGAITPRYSHVTQFISELGARGAPHELAVRFAGLLPAGIFLLAFCLFAYIALPRSRTATISMGGLALYAAGYLVAAAFPLDLGRTTTPSTSHLIHVAGGTVGYLLAPAFLFAFARASRGWPGARHLTGIAYVASALALIGLLSLSPASPVVGVSQRLLELAVLGWAALCGGYLATRTRP